MSDSTFYNQITETFHWFHQNPELSFEEYETTGRIREFLEYYNIRILDLDLKTGLAAEIQGENDGPVIALRCDIDALPVQEETELPYASAITGKMHACGHDFHTTVMLYVAKKITGAAGTFARNGKNPVSTRRGILGRCFGSNQNKGS